MSETNSPTEFDAAMDNLDVVLNALGTAKQRVRDRRRRAIPYSPPQRPDGAPSAEDNPSGRPRSGDQQPLLPDPARRRGPDQQLLETENTAESPGQDPRELRLSVSEAQALAVHLEWYSDEVDADDTDEARTRVKDLLSLADRVAQTRLVDVADPPTVGRLEAAFEHTRWDITQDSAKAGGPPEDLRRAMEATTVAARELRGEGVPQTEAAEATTSQIVVPIDTDELQVDSEQHAAIQSQLEDMGAVLEDGELVVPFEAYGDDDDVIVEQRVAVWERLHAQEIASAAAGRESMNTIYLKGQPDADGAVEVPANQRGERPARILTDEDGNLHLQEAVVRDDVRSPQKALAAEEYGARFSPRDGALWFDVPREQNEPLALRTNTAESGPRAGAGRPNEMLEYESASTQAISAIAASVAARDAIDLVEKHGPDGTRQAAVWVDADRSPTTHSDGVPSVWFNEDGSPAAFGNYENGEPSGTWAWTDDSHSFASDRAEMHGGERIPGTSEHRDRPEDGWAPVESSNLGQWAQDLPDPDAPSATAQPQKTTQPKKGPNASAGGGSGMPTPAPAHRPSGPRMH